MWVANANDNTVTKLQGSDGTALGTFNTGSSPSGLAFDGENIWVANSGVNYVTKLRASDGTVIGNYLVGQSPTHIAFDGPTFGCRILLVTQLLSSWVAPVRL